MRELGVTTPCATRRRTVRARKKRGGRRTRNPYIPQRSSLRVQVKQSHSGGIPPRGWMGGKCRRKKAERARQFIDSIIRLARRLNPDEILQLVHRAQVPDRMLETSGRWVEEWDDGIWDYVRKRITVKSRPTPLSQFPEGEPLPRVAIDALRAEGLLAG